MEKPTSSNFTLIPKLKVRRTNRRLKMTPESQESLDLSVLGRFQTLPPEIFHILLQYLPAKDISILSLVSKSINEHLINYISSSKGRRRLFLQDFHSSGFPEGTQGTSMIEHYRSLGLLFKRCTFLLPTKDRLKYFHKMLSEIPCFKLCGCHSPVQCLGLHCCGTFLKIFTAGWDEQECHRVYNFLSVLTNLSRKVESLLNRRPGSARKMELRVRLFCRNVMLDHWKLCSESAFWLTRLLKPWPIVHQARFLYIIFGPVSATDGYVSWSSVTEDTLAESSLKGLANALKLLYSAEAKEWTSDDVISLVNELSVVPQEWLLENNARLLILCGNRICFTFMASKAVNGRTTELARMIVFLVLVCEKDLYSMEWAVKTMQRICKVFVTHVERSNFLKQVAYAFAHILIEMVQLVISGGRGEEDSNFVNLSYLISAQANFQSEILHLALNCLPV